MTVETKRYTPRSCPACGATFERRAGKNTGVCISCATAKLSDVARQSRDRAGPAYEKVVRGQLRHWRAEAERLGLADT